MGCINAEKLKSEVSELRQEWLGDSTGLEVGEEGAALGAAISIFDSFDNIIVSIEQEQSEVDLEKAIDEYFGDGGQWKFGFCVGKEDFLKFARHFYELGLNIKIEKI